MYTNDVRSTVAAAADDDDDAAAVADVTDAISDEFNTFYRL